MWSLDFFISWYFFFVYFADKGQIDADLLYANDACDTFICVLIRLVFAYNSNTEPNKMMVYL